jgi:hypothetical protein
MLAVDDLDLAALRELGEFFGEGTRASILN